MTYRAIVSITFDNSDLEELAEEHGVSINRIAPDDAITAELDNMNFGNAWIEQLFVDGQPTITRLSDGMTIEINPHDD